MVPDERKGTSPSYTKNVSLRQFIASLPVCCLLSPDNKRAYCRTDLIGRSNRKVDVRKKVIFASLNGKRPTSKDRPSDGYKRTIRLDKDFEDVDTTILAFAVPKWQSSLMLSLSFRRLMLLIVGVWEVPNLDFFAVNKGSPLLYAFVLVHWKRAYFSDFIFRALHGIRVENCRLGRRVPFVLHKIATKNTGSTENVDRSPIKYQIFEL